MRIRIWGYNAQMMSVTEETTTEELLEVLRKHGTPEIIVTKLKDEFIDGESFLDLCNNLMYMQMIPQYGLQFKFRKIYLKITGTNLMLPPMFFGLPGTTVQVSNATTVGPAPSVSTATKDPASVEVSVDKNTDSTLSHMKSKTIGQRELVPNPAPLPIFSPLVQQRLDAVTGSVHSMWHKFIAELAEFYVCQGYYLRTQVEYKNIGQTLQAKYSFISEGTPLTYFTKSLSAKVRNLRMHLKKKDGDSSSCNRTVATPNKKPKVESTPMPNQHEPTRETYNENLINEEMKLLIRAEDFANMGNNFDQTISRFSDTNEVSEVCHPSKNDSDTYLHIETTVDKEKGTNIGQLPRKRR